MSALDRTVAAATASTKAALEQQLESSPSRLEAVWAGAEWSEMAARGFIGHRGACASASFRLPCSAALSTSLRGRLATAIAEAEVAARAAVAPSPAPHSRVANLIFKSTEEGKRLRTNPQVLGALTSSLAAARTPAAIRSELEVIRGRLLATGVYRDVSMHGEASIGPDGTLLPHAVDVIVDLNEATQNLETGFEQTSDGLFRSALKFSALNWLGGAETFTAAIGSSKGELSLTTIADAFGTTPGTGAFSKAGAGGSFAKTLETPTVNLDFKKPTIGSFRTPISARFRREMEHPDALSAYAVKVRELEVGLSDPTATHSVGYTCSWRDLIPAPHPTNVFSTANCPEVVDEAKASLKSALSYTYMRDRLRGTTLPIGGYRTRLRAELAGLGGDVSFAKLEATHLSAVTWGRYAPDTGYAAPLHKDAFLLSLRTGEGGAAAEGGAATAAAPARGAAGAPLRQHPGADAFGFTRMLASAGGKQRAVRGLATHAGTPVITASLAEEHNDEEAHAWTAGQQVAGWLSPGATLLLDVEAGVLAPLAQLPLGSSSGGGPRIMDRFFLPGSRVRGFEAVGPRAGKVDGGAAHGDGLGSDVKGLLTARLLLPPPVPSIRLANAGLRTQLWASVGVVARAVSVMDAESLWRQRTVSGGVGLCMPLMKEGLGIELNYALMSAGQSWDIAKTLRLQLSS